MFQFQIFLSPFHNASREGDVDAMEAIFSQLPESEKEGIVNAY